MFLPICLVAALFAAPSSAAETAAAGAVQRRPTDAELAARFAPPLVFHPEENFFPSSPLFLLEAVLAQQDREAIGREGALEMLGTPEERRDAYLALSTQEKARLATVYYRINELPSSIVIEYWFYYVWNEYSAREGLFPFRFSTSHPNDMEHLHVVLERQQPSTDADVVEPDILRPELMYVSAHEGIAPSNRYRFDGGEPDVRVPFIVELGSHAAGADADRDGLFTPGIDGESGYKMLWGVRDRGVAWSWYKSSYMDRRDNGDAVWLCPDGSEAASSCPGGSLTYRLVPVDELYRQFERLDLPRSELGQAFETDVSAFKRFFGRSNGDAEKLVLPPPPGRGKPTVPIDGFSSTERGFMFGATTVTSAPGFFFGARYSFLTGSKLIPDLMLQVDPVVTIDGEGFFSGAAMLSYPIGAVTKVIGGVGFVTDFDDDQWDWIGGLEFKLGGFRLSFTGRTGGTVTNSAMDLRLYYFF